MTGRLDEPTIACPCPPVDDPGDVMPPGVQTIDLSSRYDGKKVPI